MRCFFNFILYFSMPVFLFGCGNPSEKDYIVIFKKDINDNYFFISKPEITSEENYEDKLKSNVEFKITSLDDLYVKDGTLEGKDIIKKAIKKGDVITAYVEFFGQKKDGNWELKINLKEYNDYRRYFHISRANGRYRGDLEGHPLSFFNEGSYIIKGSDLEKITRKAIFEEELKKFNKFIPGVFISRHPISCNGKYIEANSLVGGTVKYELSIPSDINNSSSKITGSRKDRYVSVDTRVKYIGNNKIEIKELQRSRIGTNERWYSGNTWTAEISPDYNSINMSLYNGCATVTLDRYVNKDTDPNFSEERKLLRNKITGTYKSISPITKNGKYVEASMLIGGKIKYELNIPNKGDIFSSKIIGSKTSKYAIVDSKFIYHDTDTFYLKEMEKKRVGMNESWTTGDTWTVKITDNGILELSISKGNDLWEVSLRKE